MTADDLVFCLHREVIAPLQRDAVQTPNRKWFKFDRRALPLLTRPTPTDEQTLILDQVRTSCANLQIRALAGTGKTSTLEMIEAELNGPTLCIAFTRNVQKELEKRMRSTSTVRTFNGFGHRIWAKACGSNLNVDANKMRDLLTKILKEERRGQEAWDCYYEVIQGAAMAKAVGYIPAGISDTAVGLCDRAQFHATLDESPSDLAAALIDGLLALSIRTAYEGLVDFNDQIYMPALFGGSFPRFSVTMVDEEQDLSPTNRAMLSKLRGCRFITVGDPYQSIYQFRGAMQDSMDRGATEHAMTILPLSTSFRCPQAIVENARWRAPHFRWIKDGGYVKTIPQLHANKFREGAAILCRNNAPLFKLAWELLSSGRSIRVAGSDIGPKLVGTMRRLGSPDLPTKAVLSAIDIWYDRKASAGSATAADTAACMRLFANRAENLAQAIALIDHIFKKEGSITLMTGHKAKGLEFDTVYHLDPGLLRPTEQDHNLRYVIDTRSRNGLYYIDSDSIQ
jgi:superfamily I DNA/RNA helicase